MSKMYCIFAESDSNMTVWLWCSRIHKIRKQRNVLLSTGSSWNEMIRYLEKSGIYWIFLTICMVNYCNHESFKSYASAHVLYISWPDAGFVRSLKTLEVLQFRFWLFNALNPLNLLIFVEKSLKGAWISWLA